MKTPGRLRTAPSMTTIALLAASLVLLAISALVASGGSLRNPLASTDEPSPTLEPTAPSTPTPAATATPTPSPTPSPTPTPAPTPTPTPDPVDPAFLALEEALRATVDAYWAPADYAFAITDLQTGHTVGVNIDRPQYPGCVSNFLVLVSALQDVQAGTRTLDEVSGLIEATIWSSNAYTARELYRITGDGDVIAGVAKAGAIANDQLGLDQIVLSHPPGYGAESLGLDPNNWVSARQTNVALAALYHGDLLEPALRDYLLDAMTRVKPGLNYLIGATPGGVVSHKNGFFPMIGGGYVDNDAGIVRFERDGREYAYAVTFLSSAVPGKYDQIPLAQDLVAMTWAYFDERYP